MLGGWEGCSEGWDICIRMADSHYFEAIILQSEKKKKKTKQEGKSTNIFKGALRLSVDFSAETLQARW